MFFDNIVLTVVIWSLIGIVGAYLAWFLISWLILIIFCLTVPVKKQYEKPSKFYKGLLNYGYWVICKMGRVSIKASGIENVPFDTKFLLVSNHRSKFDNMIHSLCLKNACLSFISKKENFNIPIGRHYINRMCYLPLDRGNIKSGIETINRAIYFLNNDITSIGLFPEGTRSETLELLPFHDGCFKIATKTHCPIVVGVTQGTEKIHKNWPFKRTKVTFDVVKVIYGEEYKDKKSVELSDMIRNLMLEKLNENNQSEKIGE